MSDRTIGNGGIERIAAERSRQIDAEGWTAAHDDAHNPGDLAVAAKSYIEFTAILMRDPTARDLREYREGPPPDWPWHVDWWKPSDDPVRNLEKAGALIAAEIDRIVRATTEALTDA